MDPTGSQLSKLLQRLQYFGNHLNLESCARSFWYHNLWRDPPLGQKQEALLCRENDCVKQNTRRQPHFFKFLCLKNDKQNVRLRETLFAIPLSYSYGDPRPSSCRQCKTQELSFNGLNETGTEGPNADQSCLLGPSSSMVNEQRRTYLAQYSKRNFCYEPLLY